MYSILIPYRDRQKHLEILLPRLKDIFKSIPHEILILEQDDTEKFRLSSLYNIGFKHAKGDILVFHDVDYIPADNVYYMLGKDGQPYYPVQYVIFVDMDMNELPEEQIPAGYRYFKYGVGNHWGGVFIMSRKHFELINGFNPLYIGWGKEEEETHLRMEIHGLTPERETLDTSGTFFALPHKDNGPPMSDPDFIQNHVLLNNVQQNLNIGYKNIDAEVTEFELDGLVGVRWLKIKNWRLS